jgi:hypothetical protein
MASRALLSGEPLARANFLKGQAVNGPFVPVLCLAKFDEYASIGAAAFMRKYDPYWDIPLVETLPQPVIELSGVEEHAEEFALNPPPAPPGNRRRGRRR